MGYEFGTASYCRNVLADENTFIEMRGRHKVMSVKPIKTVLVLFLSFVLTTLTYVQNDCCGL
jgi:hypothetical protein